ncbi:MAG: glycoside hydrolase family 3 protein [Chloroflexi bacterium]|nr:glycoside hydrolase family 3 protein [Chloroflexota bacterium]
MSLQDKVAQMVMVGFHGQSIATSPELATMVGIHHVGGVVLLEANAHDPQQLSDLTTELQSLATSTGTGIPLFIAINHEGGIVVRITEGATEFPGNMAVAASDRPEYSYISAALAAQELRAMGVNMNLAPVLDINDNPLNPVIGARSFGESPELAAEYGRLAVQGSQDNGIIAVAKHFPGHGSVAVDSHGALPVLHASFDELNEHELVPFQAAIEEGVAGIMTAHIAVPALDGSGRPATLSSRILTELLRQQMRYDGLILTDSLGMGGISTNWGQAQAAIEAVQAGADIVLSTTPIEAHIAIVQTLASAVQRGEIPVERIDQAVLRILRAKYAYGLFEPLAAPNLDEVGSPEHQAIADQIALGAVTLLRDNNNIPLPPPPSRLLLISPDQLPPAASENGTAFAELLRGRGYEVTELVFNLDFSESRDYVYATAVAQAPAHDVVIFGEWELTKRYINWDDQWQENLIGVLHQTSPKLIVVAWHNPASILRCPQVPAFLTAYGNTPAQVAAVVAVLTGEHVPTGHLPITLSEAIPTE